MAWGVCDQNVTVTPNRGIGEFLGPGELGVPVAERNREMFLRSCPFPRCVVSNLLDVESLFRILRVEVHPPATKAVRALHSWHSAFLRAYLLGERDCSGKRRGVYAS